MVIDDPQTPEEREALWAVIERDGPLDGVAVQTEFVDCLDVPDVEDLSLGECTDLISALERLRAKADGVQQQVLVQVAEALEARDLDRHGPAVAVKGYYLDQIACLLRISPVTARDRIEQARALVRHFPDVIALVKAGTVSLLQARFLYLAAESTIDRLTRDGGDVAAFTDELQAALLPRLPELTCGEVRAKTAKLAAHLAPQTVEQAHAEAYEERKVTTMPLPDGMSLLQLLSGADEVAQIYTALTATAQKNSDDDSRSMDQRRADQLHTWAINALNTASVTAQGANCHDETAEAPGAGEMSPAGSTDAAAPMSASGAVSTQSPDAAPSRSASTTEPADPARSASATKSADSTVTADPDSSAGAAGPADSAVSTGTSKPARQGGGCGVPFWQGRRPAIQVSVALSTLLGRDEQPGDLTGHGPIPASLARRIAADPTSTWSRIITDPTGRVLDYQQKTYRPPADLREHVLTRDPTCRFPGCNRSTRRGELDHIQDFARGGHTSASNLQGLCKRHHHLKSETDWQVRRDPGTGDTTWTDPDGHQSIRRAHTLPIDTTTETTAPEPDPPPF